MIDAVVVSKRKHLFQHKGLVRLVSGDDAEKAALIIFPDARLERGDLFEALPATLRARAAKGEVGLVFDGSKEGWAHSAERTQDQHRFAAEVGVRPDQCVYLTQDRGYARDYAAYCDQQGLRERVTVLTYDYWIRRFFAGHEHSGAAAFAERLERYRARPAHHSRRFLSLNLTARPTKVMFLLSLMRDGLWDQGHISFGGFAWLGAMHRIRERQGMVQRFRQLMAEEPGFADLAAELDPYLQELDAYGEVLLGEVQTDPVTGKLTSHPNTDTRIDEHADSWFTVVTETDMMDRFHRITEKPLKALVNFQPLIFFGNPGSLTLLRELGFQTFEGFFDERYDEVLEPRRRFDLAYAEVQRLCRMDEAELARLEQGISEVLIHNAEWGLTRLPQIYRASHDRALTKAIQRSVAIPAFRGAGG